MGHPGHGAGVPRQWDRFTELLPAADRGGDLAAAYARLLASPDQAVREEAARRWCEWEDTHMSLAPGYQPHLSVQELPWQLVFARLVTHYWGHGCFLADNEVLANMARIDAMAEQRRHAGPMALSACRRPSARFCVSWPSVIMRTNAADMAVQLAEERNEQHRPDDDRRTSRSARSA